ncbi:MAG: helix-hairpin-helix domain-containing protein, partial [Butyrivibrio sp.]
ISDDVKTIQKAPGIGGKTAQKLIIELKDKLSLEDVITHGMETENRVPASDPARNEAIEALVALGYTSAEALRAVKSVEDSDSMDSEALLKAALKKLAFM